MDPRTLLGLFMALFLADFLWGRFLGFLNYRHARSHSAEVPREFRETVSAEEHRKSSAYSMAKMRLAFATETVSAIVTLAVVATGLFGVLDSLIDGWLSAPYWRGAAFLGAVASVSFLVSMPFELWSSFVIERRFGFNTMTWRTWLLDGLKGVILGMAIGLPLLFLLYAFMDAAGALWWLWAACAFSAINLGLSVIYPLFIAPLFNKFERLPDGTLNARIRDLAAQLGFATSGVFVMDGSKRSRHANAYFTGFGKAKRIVLYDTLTAMMTEDEVLAVLAHEIGHEKKRHVLKLTAVSVALSFAAFWLLALLEDWQSAYAAFGFATQSRHALLLILGLASGPCTFFLTPAFSAWSRRHEYEADRYAARATDPVWMRSALVRLNRGNAANLSPHPLYAFWHYSHPALAERLRALGSGPVSGA